MGIIDRVTTEVSQLSDRRQSPMLGDLLVYLADPASPGLEGVLNRLRSLGYHQTVLSWIGRGPNLPLAPAQLALALGPEIRVLVRRTGLSAETVAAQLAHLLPRIVDLLTPNGRLPEPVRAPDALTRLASLAPAELRQSA